MAEEGLKSPCFCYTMKSLVFGSSPYLRIALLSSLILCVSLEDPAGYMRREFSLSKPYDGGTLQYWDILGSTVATSDFLRLTPDHQSKQGALWNFMPCFSRNWEIHIHFKVHGQGTRLFGDGFAFWYTKDRSQLGPVFGSKDYFNGLGVFFDTYSNHNGEHAHEHPYISAQVANGTVHYDHDRDGTHSEVAGCTSYFRATETETSVAIRYLGSDNKLTDLLRILSKIEDRFKADLPLDYPKSKMAIQQNVEGDDTWKECLDVTGVELPTGYHFGLSAATGDLADNHDIISMKFYELEDPGSENAIDHTHIIPRAVNAASSRDHIEDVKGSFSPRTKKVLNWMLGLAVLGCIGCGIGFVVYQKRQQDSLKRFY